MDSGDEFDAAPEEIEHEPVRKKSKTASKFVDEMAEVSGEDEDDDEEEEVLRSLLFNSQSFRTMDYPTNTKKRHQISTVL